MVGRNEYMRVSSKNTSVSGKTDACYRSIVPIHSGWSLKLGSFEKKNLMTDVGVAGQCPTMFLRRHVVPTRPF